MHELSIASSVVEMCRERAEGAQVRRVTLEIGQLSAVLPDALRFCFDICAAGTPLEGSVLDIVEVPGAAVCDECGGEVRLSQPYGQCGCGCTNLKVVAGEDLKVVEMEVA